MSSAPAQAGRQGCEPVACGGTRCDDYPRCSRARAGLRREAGWRVRSSFPARAPRLPLGGLGCGRRHLHQLRGHHTGARAAESDSAAAAPRAVSHRTCLRLGDLCHSERGQPGPQRHGSRVASVTPLSSAPRGPRLPPTAGASVQPACLAPGPNQDPFQNSSRQPPICARNPASERARVRRLDFICTEDSPQETTWYRYSYQYFGYPSLY